jgi:hypothetical protein
VGHSLAGITVSQVAENIPERIKKLFYITAYIPSTGDSLIDEIKKSSSTPLSSESTIDLKKNSIALKKSLKIKQLFYNLCPDEDSFFSMNLLQNEPYRPFLEAVTLTNTKFGKVEKIYIECLKDNVLAEDDQHRMYSQHGCDVVSINADHSPFFSAPRELANAILDSQQTSWRDN